MFEIDDQGIPVLTATVRAAINPLDPRISVSLVGDKIVVLNPNANSIEYYSGVDGCLLDSVPLLKGMDPVLQSWAFYGNQFWIDLPESRRYFDLKTKTWIRLPEGKFSLADSSANDKLWLAYHREGNQHNVAVLIDKAQNKVVSRLERFTLVEFLDNESVLTLSPNWGMTIQRIATKDGSVMQSWSLYWWVVPILVGSILMFVIWSLFWIRETGSNALSVWGTIVVLGGVPALVFILRTKFVGDSLDLGRGPIQYAQGVIYAWLLISTIWMVHSRQRIVIRALPLVVTAALLFAAVTFSFSKDLNQVILGLVQMLVPVFLYLFGCLVFRRFGFRLWAPVDESVVLDHTSTPKERLQNTLTITIKDMFLLVAGAALVFATMNPLLPSLKASLGDMKHILDGISVLVIACFIQGSAWWLGMSGRKLYGTKMLVFSILLMALVMEPVYQFVTGNTTIRDVIGSWGMSVTMVRVVATSSLATVWMGLVFRSAGWTWSRGQHTAS
jgi:hypothetical protein